MQLSLDERETEVLRAILRRSLNELLLEIAHTDHRDMRRDLKTREQLVEGILHKLSAVKVG